MAVESSGPYASLHLVPDRQPRQHPTTQFFTGRMPFLPPNQQCQYTEDFRYALWLKSKHRRHHAYLNPVNVRMRRVVEWLLDLLPEQRRRRLAVIHLQPGLLSVSVLATNLSTKIALCNSVRVLRWPFP